jgi:integrase
MRRELTDALIRTLRAPEGGRLEVWDTRCEGLVLRVAQSGRATFHARARGPDGRKRFAGLGVWPATSLSTARTDARLVFSRMQRGADPVAERRAAREERVRAVAMPTLRELGETWAKAHARDTSARYRAELLASIARGCGGQGPRTRPTGASPRDLMAQRIDSLTVDDVAYVIQMTRARGDGEARHLVRALRRLFGFAIAMGHVPTSVVDEWVRREKGGRRSIPWMRDGIRERVLSDAELEKLWNTSATLDVTARVFTRLLMLTACRSGEITGLVWRELKRDVDDLGAERFMALVLPPARTKNRRGHRVPLAIAAAAELQALAPSSEDGSQVPGLVFPGIGGRTAGICRALRRATGVQDWTWHDLRRTAATGMARLGRPREHVEAALNHISTRGGLTGIYQRYDYDREAEQALQLWQEHVASLMRPARRRTRVIGLQEANA